MRIPGPAVLVAFLSAPAIAGCEAPAWTDPETSAPVVFPTSIGVHPAFSTLTRIGQVDTFSVLLIHSGSGGQVPELVYELSWAGSDPAVFTVDTLGSLAAVVTAVANGSGVLLAMEHKSGLTDSAFVMVEQIPRLLEVVSGGNQEGRAGSKLPSPVVIRVTDFGGTGVTGVTVSFSPEDGAGSVHPGSAVSDDEGLVSTEWTLGDGLGEQSIRISFSGGPVHWVRATAGS